MPISDYYSNLRRHVGTQCLFTPCVAAIIRNEAGHILFQDPGGPFWSLPAGAIELGESPAQAVIREVYEETGLFVRPVRLIATFGGESFRLTYPDGNEVEYVATMFECEVVSGKLEAIDGESKQLAYFPKNERPPLALPYPDQVFEKSEASSYFDWEEQWLTDLQQQYC
ncbi:NUDIX domain-containing protein [Exiguobacterium acetylicum]|uniref:NUDIX domain-containing protein n=1 Tax=Exiguobacterium acetylicum TaxID=41170 RepID=UPI0034D4BF53